MARNNVGPAKPAQVLKCNKDYDNETDDVEEYEEIL